MIKKILALGSQNWMITENNIPVENPNKNNGLKYNIKNLHFSSICNYNWCCGYTEYVQ